MNLLNQVKNYFNITNPSGSTLNQKRLTIRFIGVSLAIAATTFAGLHFYYGDFNGTVFLLGMLFLDLLVLFFVCKFNRTLATHLFTSILALTLVYFYISIGGSILTWFPMISVAALLGLGFKAGINWLIITLIIQTALFFYPVDTDFVLPNFWAQVDETYKAFDYYIVAIGGITIITFLMMYVEFARDTAFSELQQIRKGLEVQVHKEVNKRMKQASAHEKEMELTQKEIIMTMSTILETRSSETGFHVQRVCEYSSLLAKLSGLNEAEQELIYISSSMHDIGKVAIPDDVLNKPGRYTDEEYDIMKLHTKIGYDMLNNTNRPIIQSASSIALNHHEWWNGEGYPNKLKGEEIPLYARIVAIADVFDALGSDRVYKKAWPLEKILNHFNKLSGIQFDPNLIQLFMDNLDQFLEIRSRLVD